MARPWIANEQWLGCELCGVPYPVSQLTTQQTEVSSKLRRCPRCVDSTDNNYRETRIAEALKQTSKDEGKDLRWDPALWFASADEVR